MRLSIYILLALALVIDVAAYSVERRAFFGTLGGSAFIGWQQQSAQAIISSGACASGIGDGCSDLSEGNEFIRSLQEQSAENRDKNVQQARDAYYTKNYPDYFNSVGKTMVKKPDGGFMLVSMAELEELKKQNRLTTEMPTAFGGKIRDMTQKPIIVLKEE
jgi:hypothetical protein